MGSYAGGINYNLWPCQKVCESLTFFLDNIYMRFGSKLYRTSIGIPMGTNCAPLVADLFLFCYERECKNKKSLPFGKFFQLNPLVYP